MRRDKVPLDQVIHPLTQNNCVLSLGWHAKRFLISTLVLPQKLIEGEILISIISHRNLYRILSDSFSQPIVFHLSQNLFNEAVTPCTGCVFLQQVHVKHLDWHFGTNYILQVRNVPIQMGATFGSIPPQSVCHDLLWVEHELCFLKSFPLSLDL